MVVFAGPQVSGAIRNQFNLVGNTVNNGTTGGSTGGGSEGGVSAAVQAAVAKDAKDWTLDEQKAAVTTTSDKLFLLSYSEIVPTSYWASSFPWTFSEGAQYEAFKGKVTNNYSSNGWCLKNGVNWWERTVDPYGSSNFLFVSYSGNPACNHNPMNLRFVCPAFCF